MKLTPHTVTLRRVYVYLLDKDDTIQYIGSSSCALKTLEYNHRNAFMLYPDEKHTKFRAGLQRKIKKGYFKTLIELNCDQPMIEHLEGELIRAFRPPYNIDTDPVKSSQRHNRY